MKNYAKRRGFTLVELLIVIVVIGILSAMMMLSSTEAVSSAKAAKIISDLRNIKTATLAWYADNLDAIEPQIKAWTFSLHAHESEIAKYMGTDIGDYQLYGNYGKGSWSVWLSVSDPNVKKKLASRAKSLRLMGTLWMGDWIFNYDATSPTSTDVYTNEPYVGLVIR